MPYVEVEHSPDNVFQRRRNVRRERWKFARFDHCDEFRLRLGCGKGRSGRQVDSTHETLTPGHTFRKPNSLDSRCPTLCRICSRPRFQVACIGGSEGELRNRMVHTPTYVLVKAAVPMFLLRPKSPNLTNSPDMKTVVRRYARIDSPFSGFKSR